MVRFLAAGNIGHLCDDSLFGNGDKVGKLILAWLWIRSIYSRV